MPQNYAGSFIFSLDSHPSDLDSTSLSNSFMMFFCEVSSLPPRWEIEFRIDLIPVARPVVLPPRRMTFREKVELRK